MEKGRLHEKKLSSNYMDGFNLTARSSPEINFYFTQDQETRETLINFEQF